jgi:hypothetical protein
VPYGLISLEIDVGCLITDFLSLFCGYFSFCFLFVFAVSLVGFGLVPPLFVYIFPPFLIKFLRVWRHRMAVSRGANLVGMSMMPSDACPFSLLIKK